jgi:succinate dehydrogenase hydrophobic anchor subunit
MTLRATAVIKAMALLALLAVMPVAGAKYVAVVETDVDAASGASAELNAAEVREITAELRRQATKNLPSGRYSVMTSETVQSMGGAVLEECAEENCVIVLGSKIGADYIVRGTVSKFGTKLTLSVELYETGNGTLVISSDPVRSETKTELLEMATTASANMFREFAGGADADDCCYEINGRIYGKYVQ